MSVFSDAEIAYLQSKTMGRLASIGTDGRPHLTPLTYHFNATEDAIDLGGIDFGNTKKWRDMLQNPRVAFLVDDQLQARIRPGATASHRQLGTGNGGFLAARSQRDLRFGQLVGKGTRPAPEPSVDQAAATATELCDSAMVTASRSLA